MFGAMEMASAGIFTGASYYPFLIGGGHHHKKKRKSKQIEILNY